MMKALTPASLWLCSKCNLPKVTDKRKAVCDDCGHKAHWYGDELNTVRQASSYLTPTLERRLPAHVPKVVQDWKNDAEIKAELLTWSQTEDKKVFTTYCKLCSTGVAQRDCDKCGMSVCETCHNSFSKCPRCGNKENELSRSQNALSHKIHKNNLMVDLFGKTSNDYGGRRVVPLKPMFSSKVMV